MPAFFPFTPPPMPSLRALAFFGLLLLLLCLLLVCVCVCSSCEHGFDIHPTGGFELWSLVLMLWSMVLVTGIGLKQWSLVDDG